MSIINIFLFISRHFRVRVDNKESCIRGQELTFLETYFNIINLRKQAWEDPWDLVNLEYKYRNKNIFSPTKNYLDPPGGPVFTQDSEIFVSYGTSTISDWQYCCINFPILMITKRGHTHSEYQARNRSRVFFMKINF